MRYEPLLILGMALVTFAIRYPMLALANRFELSQLVKDALKFVPPAVLAAIIAPSVLMRNDAALGISLGNSYLVAALVAGVVAWRSQNLLLTIVIGMATLWLWMWLAPGL